MKQYLNTLYITQEKCFVRRDNSTIVVEREGVKQAQFPVHTIGQIVCMGYGILVSSQLMEFCGENGIAISWLTANGRFQGRVEGAVRGNVLLRREQFRWADSPERCANVARYFVAAKINNGRMNLQRTLRNHPDCDPQGSMVAGITRMAQYLGKVERCGRVEEIRGIEGEAAACYFDLFDHQIVQQKEYYRFETRNRRPPLDRVNALLSYGYSILALDCQSALESVGLDPYVGFLHVDRPGRPSLALDLMEEFRHPFVDRLVLSCINLGMLKANDVELQETGEWRLSNEGRKAFLTAYQERKRETIKHPFLEEVVEIGLLFLLQARLLARHIRGDLDFYPAMVWR
jgi:CRISPR-associated protein Cas1